MPTATTWVDASRSEVRGVLLRPLDLPRWNPAFVSISGPAQAEVGPKWRITVRPAFPGSFGYERIEEDVLVAGWRALATSETGTWELSDVRGGVQVRHTFTHRGLLARPLTRAFGPVAQYRVDRLKAVAEQLHRTGALPWNA